MATHTEESWPMHSLVFQSHKANDPKTVCVYKRLIVNKGGSETWIFHKEEKARTHTHSVPG